VNSSLCLTTEQHAQSSTEHYTLENLSLGPERPQPTLQNLTLKQKTKLLAKALHFTNLVCGDCTHLIYTIYSTMQAMHQVR